MSNQYEPDDVSAPGETIRGELVELDFTEENLAEFLGESEQFTQELLGGEQPITPQIAEHLEEFLGIPASFWIERERIYRAKHPLSEQSHSKNVLVRSGTGYKTVLINYNAQAIDRFRAHVRNPPELNARQQSALERVRKLIPT